jgi:Holliday junction DNA helicase RuvB
MDRRILETIARKFDGGPVGLSTRTAAIGEEEDTIEEVYEPYLIREGLLQRTPQGRTLTSSGWGIVGGRGGTGLFG